MVNFSFIALGSIILTIIIAAYALAWWFDRRLRKEQSMVLLNQNIQGMQQRLDQVSAGLNTRLDNAARIISEVNKELGHMQEIGSSMKDLQNFLRSPKLRGNIGEEVLADMLAQYFPREYFELQYKFATGQVVDVLLKTDNGNVAIDAKFPLENFTALMQAQTDLATDSARKLFFRDVKKHITDVSKKYILPEEGTMNFALLYIPSEAIYYEIIRESSDVTEYARERNILLVSPNSLLYYLKVVLVAMQGKKIEEQARLIMTTIQAVARDAGKLGDELGVMTTHMTNAKAALDRVTAEYSKLSGKIDQMKLLE